MAFMVFGALCVLVITLIYFYLKKAYSPAPHHLPGLKPQIVFGNLVNTGILTKKSTFTEVLLDFQRRYGDKFQFWFGSQRCLAFSRLEEAKKIFADRQTFEQSPLFLPDFNLICPTGIATLAGPKWKRHIRVLLPMLKRAKIISHLDMIIQCADRLIDQNLRDGEIHRNLISLCQSLTMNVIGFIGFDHDFEAHIESPTKKALQILFSTSASIMLIPWIPRWLKSLYLKFNTQYQESRKHVRRLSEKLIEEEKNRQEDAENQRPKNLIASMVSSLNELATDEQASSGLTSAEIFDEMIMMILAGYETTSTALSWFIYFASKNPDVQQRMKDELRQHDLLMTKDMQNAPPLSPETLNSLVYCECVTKEVLRLAPVASLTTRIATQDTVVDDVKISRGQTVFILLHNINTDPRYWHHADPKQFVPERFLGKDKDHDAMAMIPFGGGHRACIGQELAFLELKSVIVRLMQRGVTFEDTPDNTGGYDEDITCFPKHLVVGVHFDKD